MSENRKKSETSILTTYGL